MKNLLFKKYIYYFLLLFLAASASAQKKSVYLLQSYKTLPATLAPYLHKGNTVQYDKNKAGKLIATRPAAITLIFTFENKDWVIELTANELYSKGFFVTTGSRPGEKVHINTNEVLHYRGRIKGKPHSFAAVSIMANQIMAVIADEKGNINIGAINTPSAKLKGEHVIYRDADLLIKNDFNCGTDETLTAPVNPLPEYRPSEITSTTLNAEPVDIYFEADHTTFTNNGSSINNTVNYVTALFNVVHTLFENDSINTKISSIKVWDIQDPYNSLITTASVLNAFGNNMSNGFPGDVAHFLCQRYLGGGRAYLDVLCSSSAFKTGVSGNLTNSFNPLPTYSWNPMVITHEIGHNLGSQHTQYCGWPGGAIDNCYTTEGGCAPGPAPVNGGTIMSYCHLASYGINFSNGFGPLPGQLIRNKVKNSTCLSPGIYFETTFQTIAEENAIIENGCADYTLLTAKLTIPYAPSQPANITLLPAGSTGLEIGTNKDIEITPMNFTLDSSNLSQTISFKVYNDALIESTESLLLNFNIDANGGNAVKRGFSTTHSINITDTDHRPDSTPNMQLYYESFDTIVNGTGNWVQSVLYGTASPNRWYIAISNNPQFPTKSAYISNDGINNAYSGYSTDDSCAVRLVSPSINASGFTNLHISYLYNCAGEYTYLPNGGTGQGENLVGKDYGKLLYSIDNGTNWMVLKDNIAGRYGKMQEDIAFPAATGNSSNIRIAFEWWNNSNTVNNPPLLIDSIVIYGTSISAIQTEAHSGNANDAYLGPYQTVHFYNPETKNIMATVQNTSAFDFGCTKLEIIRTGNGAIAAWDTTMGTKISGKAYTFLSENTDAAATYNLTLYYSNAEINGWVAATGNNMTDIKIVKTDGDLLSAPVVTEPGFSSTNSIVNYGISGDKAISAAFTGLGSFALSKLFNRHQCHLHEILYDAGSTGLAYQWQVNTGNGYSNIENNSYYTGANAILLRLTPAATSWYGYQYRCAITTTTGTVYSPEYILTFAMTWLGTQSKAWENPLNWSCAAIPDEHTDVIINSGTSFTPQVNSNTTIRSLKVSPMATVEVRSGISLTIKK